MEIDIDTAAKMLATPQATLRRWARQGKIPARERSGTYVFRKDELAKWARQRNIPLTALPESGIPGPAQVEISLYESIKRGGIFFSVPGNNVHEVLQAASNLIILPEMIDRKALRDDLIEREALASTGIGNGVAFPHPRYPLEDIPAGGVIAACFLEKEVDFKSIDGLPVFVLFMLLNPDTETHLKLLSRLSFCLRDSTCIRFLRECERPEDLLQKVREMERDIARHEEGEGV
jgi:nitrogen PTS system EIIA component